MRLLIAMPGLMLLSLAGGCLFHMSPDDEWRNRGELVLHGDVIDGSGRPLQDVRMHVAYEKIVWEEHSFGGLPSGGLESVRHQIQTVGPTFSIEAKDCAGVRLSFHKDGYYTPPALGFAVSGPDEADRNVPAIFRKPPRLRQENIQVALEAVGFVPPKLTRAKVSVGFASKTGEGEAVELLVPRKWNQPPSVYHQLTTATTAPDGCIYAVAQTEPDGTISTVGDPDGRHLLARRVNLALSGSCKDDGFARFLPRDPADRACMVFFEMKQAPQTGYERELQLDGYASIYFYFKLGNLYGKGQADVGDLRFGGGRLVSVTVNVEALSRERDRDLRTRKDGNPYGLD